VEENKMAEKKAMKKFFEQGGPRFFISTEVSTTREVYTENHQHCVLVQDWEDVVTFFREMTDKVRFHVSFKRAEVFTTPRLCKECMKHASQPALFDNAKFDVECLCRIEKDARCKVHK
jgi:hypothetical protein